MLFSISLVFIITCIVSTISIRFIINYSYKHSLFDLHTKRKIHKGDIPRLGGVAFVPVAILSFVCGNAFLSRYGVEIAINDVKSIIGLVMSIVIVYFFGVADDIRGLRYRTKFNYQIAAGVILCLTGFLLNDFHGVLGLYDLPFMFGVCVTVFMIIFCINAFNFIDGIDGLSSSIALLSLLYYTIILYYNGNYMLLLSLSFISVLLPFFYFNVFGKEATLNKTFMGDTGSTVLGLVLCVLAIVVDVDPKTTLFNKNPFLVAFSPLMLPCFDVINVVTYRLLKGRNPFKADDNHFHHKLLKFGLSQHTTLIIELIVYIFMTGLSLYLSDFIGVNVVIAIMLIAWMTANITLTDILEKK